MNRRFRTFTLLVVFPLSSFAYGLAAARYELFPFPTIVSIKHAIFGASEASPEPGPAARVDAEVSEHPFWHKAPPGALQQGVLSPAEIEAIKGLPYVGDGVKTAAHKIITEHDLERAGKGHNLVVSGHGPQAHLFDMKGEVRHSWQHDPDGAWPGQEDADPRQTAFWRRAHVFPNGDLLAIYDGVCMIKLDKKSKLLWANPGRYHHDMFVAENGDIYTLSRHPRSEHDRVHLEGEIEEDFIAVLSPDGVEKSRVSVLSAFLDSDYSSVLAFAASKGDILHTNTIELMDGRFADRHPMFKKGNVLISVRNLSYIAVVDLEAEKVVWAMGGLWKFQHQPTVLEGGNLLLFDNLGDTGTSKVIELDPLTQEVVWAYRGTPDNPLYSHFLGSAARLANGHTLITESTSGRAIEVLEDGEIVWEFYNPARGGDDGELIASVLEVVRLEPGFFSAEFDAIGGAPKIDEGAFQRVQRQIEAGGKK